MMWLLVLPSGCCTYVAQVIRVQLKKELKVNIYLDDNVMRQLLGGEAQATESFVI